MNLPISVFILLILFFSSCTKGKSEFRSKAEFTNHINNLSNGFVQIRATAEMRFEARLTPASNLNPGQHSIHFRISRIDGKPVILSDNVSRKEAHKRETYLITNLKKDVWLEDEHTVHECISSSYEKNPAKPSVNASFIFKNFEPQSDIYFVFQDSLFDQGLIRIKFSGDKFEKCIVK